MCVCWKGFGHSISQCEWTLRIFCHKVHEFIKSSCPERACKLHHQCFCLGRWASLFGSIPGISDAVLGRYAGINVTRVWVLYRYDLTERIRRMSRFSLHHHSSSPHLFMSTRSILRVCVQDISILVYLLLHTYIEATLSATTGR